MKTLIFKNYREFLDRQDKEVNGVSKSFAKQHPGFEEQNSTNEGCWNCSDCRDCRSCSDCSNCSFCRYCSDCSDCRDCRYCSDFEENPQRIVSPVLGSRAARTTYYFTEKHEQIVCGCFRGTLEEFKKQVEKVHGDNVYGFSYLKWITGVEIYKDYLHG